MTNNIYPTTSQNYLTSENLAALLFGLFQFTALLCLLVFLVFWSIIDHLHRGELDKLINTFAILLAVFVISYNSYKNMSCGYERALLHILFSAFVGFFLYYLTTTINDMSSYFCSKIELPCFGKKRWIDDYPWIVTYKLKDAIIFSYFFTVLGFLSDLVNRLLAFLLRITILALSK